MLLGEQLLWNGRPVLKIDVAWLLRASLFFFGRVSACPDSCYSWLLLVAHGQLEADVFLLLFIFISIVAHGWLESDAFLFFMYFVGLSGQLAINCCVEIYWVLFPLGHDMRVRKILGIRPLTKSG